MSSNRSNPETLNANRQRKPLTTLEQLNHSLAILEAKLARSRQEEAPRPGIFAEPVSQAEPLLGPSYRAIAQDIDRMRDQEDGLDAVARIAAELRGLHEDLRHEVTAGLHREFETLRHDIEREREPAGAAKDSDQLGVELERLSGTIQALAEKNDDRGIHLLRLELEQVRSAMETLARDDSVRAIDDRWSAFEQRFDGAAQGDDAAGLAMLGERLDVIGRALDELPQSLSLRPLEEKVRTLATALDHFANRQSGPSDELIGLIDERLDEISRAIVASTVAAQANTFDPAALERIEQRIGALAEQIEEVSGSRPADEVIERLNTLVLRVDELAAESALPAQALERLVEQITIIAERIDHASPLPDADRIVQGLERRFDALADMLVQRQGDALASGTEAIHNLESRLSQISDRLDSSTARFARLDPDLIRSLEAQVAGLSQHLARPGTPLPEFEDIAPRLAQIEQSIAGTRETILVAAREAAESAVHSMSGSAAESSTVAGLAQDLKTLESLMQRSDDRNAKTFEAIHDTLLKIVDRLGSLEAPAPEEATPAPALAKITVDSAPTLDLDDPLPLPGDDTDNSPEDVEAHDELVAAVMHGRTPADAAVEAARAALGDDPATESEAPRKGSLFGGIARAFKRRGKQEAPAPVDEPALTAESVEAPAAEEQPEPALINRPLEPGSGAPDLRAIMKRVREERVKPAKQQETEVAKSDFIAAARRAAQAAAAEAETLKRQSAVGGPVKALRIGDLLKARRKPILMAAGAIMLALAGLQLGKAFLSDPAQVASKAAQPKAATKIAAVKDTKIEPSTPAKAAAPKKTDSGAAMLVQPAAKAADASALSSIKKPVDISPERIDAPATTGSVATVKPAVPESIGTPALREAAMRGDDKALFEIGARYAEARGISEDLAAAAGWYEKAAEKGLAPAQYRIGNFYEKGIGVARDIARAKDWYQRAAKQGNASAMHNLAVLLAMSPEDAGDKQEAVSWFHAAADLGVKDSQFNLGILAAKGVGMKQDLEESYKWLALVAKSGDKDAAAKRDEIAKSLRPEQLENARAKAELWAAKPLDPAANTVELPADWQDAPTTTASVDVKKAVQNIQLILNKNGYTAGAADGVMGGQTKQAIMAFQADNDLPRTGEVDNRLVEALLARK
jgi:localization factor PodJL